MASEQNALQLNSVTLNLLHQKINNWYKKHARDLPWRAPNRTGWSVMVSEFMLQQTPVVRVLPVWEQWVRRWPTPADLAQADSAEVLRAWGRLGYPRRALRLHAAAKSIVENHQGQVPQYYDELIELPGVGSYTAAAVTVFAFGNRATVIDTNIRRVHARLISGKALPSKSLTAAETRLADQLMPTDLEGSVLWNASVMELGALICTARQAHCHQCPVQSHCAWVAAGKPPADYVPKGQSWAGTDRQLRGAMMAVLREALGPIDKNILLSAGRSADVIISEDIAPAVTKLQKLTPSAEQIQRCYQGLLDDGLAQESDNKVRL